METKMNFPIIIHESEYGFAVNCPTLPGCASQGKTRTEALENIRDAIKAYLEAVEIVEAEKEPGAELEMIEVG